MVFVIQKKSSLKRYVLIIVFFLFHICSPHHPVNIQQSAFLIAGLVKVKPDKNQNKSFNELRCTEDDKEAITFIITSMGEKGKLWLLMHQNELNEKGEEISGVHPLKFLSTVFQDDYLKKVCMPAIFEDRFKRNGFLDGLGPNMTKETQKGKIQEYLKDFMKEIKLDLSHLNTLMDIAKQCAEKEDWYNFVYFLIEYCNDDGCIG